MTKSVRRLLVLLNATFIILFTMSLPSIALPSAPSNISAVASTTGTYLNGSVTLNWDFVAGADSYAVKLTRLGTGDTRTETVAGEKTTSITITGLVGGSTYSAQVRTVVLTELSDWSSAALTFQPITAPAAPAKPTAIAGNASATVSWVKVSDSNNGGSAITSYVIKEVNSGLTLTADPTASSIDFTGLTKGSTVAFTVSAVNSASTTGNTSVQSDGISLPNVPATPSAPTIAAGLNSGEITVSWSVVSDNGGSAITGYALTLYKNSVLNSATDITDPATLSKTYTGLGAGSYTAKIVAKNSVGDSAQSPLSAAFTLTIAVTPIPVTPGGGGGGSYVPEPVASPSASASPSVSPSASASASTSASASPSASPSSTATPKPTPSPSPSSSPAPTSSPSASVSPSPSESKASTPQITSLASVRLIKSDYLWVAKTVSISTKKLDANKIPKTGVTLKLKSSAQLTVPNLPASNSGTIKVKSPSGYLYSVATFKLAKPGTIKTPALTFRQPGTYSLIVTSGKKIVTVKIKIVLK